MKTTPITFDRLARTYSITDRTWYDTYRAIFAGHKHPHINFGQTGRVYETKKGRWFFSADGLEDGVCQVNRRDLFGVHCPDQETVSDQEIV